MQDTIHVPSSKDGGAFYTVKPHQGTCTCPGFEKKGNCSHLKHLGVYPKIPNWDLDNPSKGQATSAMIKAVRLRRPFEAVYWYGYLSRIPKNEWSLHRRMLIMCGEDNVNIPLMWDALETSLAGYKPQALRDSVQLIKLCKSENWYHSQGGREYIYAFRMAANKPYKGVSVGKAVDDLVEAVALKDKIKAAAIHDWMCGEAGGIQAMADFIYATALANDRVEALQTISVWHRNPKYLKDDGNYTGQALMRLFFDFGDHSRLEVTKSDMEMAEKALNCQWTDQAPKYHLYYGDGIHTSGNDHRFTGTIDSFACQCRAYEEFGRLDPTDLWDQNWWYNRSWK